ncbi:hypothetical protein NDU88_005126 [Pleurodeles waltl]|uniref:Uncharacterized protein n=1 Tax=Pleurodeles waltl TaxID=8319 RepID=A0AAV7WXW6_PLEWA|nr:hypothetical protein NDU88_005126 [Pleurodeles waltl]
MFRSRSSMFWSHIQNQAHVGNVGILVANFCNNLDAGLSKGVDEQFGLGDVILLGKDSQNFTLQAVMLVAALDQLGCDSQIT